MQFSKDHDDRELERLLAGNPPAGDADAEALNAFVAQVRDAYAEAPDEPTQSRQLAAITATAAELLGAQDAPARSNTTPRTAAGSRGPLNRWRHGMTRNRGVVLAGKLVAVSVVGMALMTGLAVAGVTLPTPAQDAFKAAGVNLPNQTSDNPQVQSNETSQAVLDVIAQRESFASGCEFGQAVAAAASGEQRSENACDKANEAAARRNGERNGDGVDAQSHGDAHNEFGQTTAADAKENARNDGRAFGERTRQRALEHAQTKSGGRAGGDTNAQSGPETGQSKSQEGRSIGESQSQGGGSTGETRSQQGQSIGESISGGPRP